MENYLKSPKYVYRKSYKYYYRINLIFHTYEAVSVGSSLSAIAVWSLRAVAFTAINEFSNIKEKMSLKSAANFIMTYF